MGHLRLLSAMQRYVGYWHKADITIALNQVCFRGKADIERTCCHVR
jgi:hypothetical protein